MRMSLWATTLHCGSVLVASILWRVNLILLSRTSPWPYHLACLVVNLSSHPQADAAALAASVINSLFYRLTTPACLLCSSLLQIAIRLYVIILLKSPY